MKANWYHFLLICSLIAAVMIPSATAGGFFQPADAGKTVSASYWSNYISSPDYTVPESAFNPPDRDEWDKYYGSIPDSGSSGEASLVSPYRYGVPGGLLPFDEDGSQAANTSTSSTETLPASPYPRMISPVPVSPFAPGTMSVTVPVVPYLPSHEVVPSSFSGQPALIIIPLAVLPPLPDTANGTGTSSGDEETENGPVVFISGLDVHEEYVKITNSGLTPVSLTGWKVMSGSTRKSITFIDWPQGNGQVFTFTLYPLTTVTIHYGKSGTVTATDLYWPSAQNYWNDAGDTALLYAPDGSLASSYTR